MITKTLISAAVALSLLGSSMAYAQRNDDRGRNEQREDRGRPGGHDERGERGAGPNHEFHKGGRLPPEYRSRRYVVEDWRSHHLSAPPRGYQWVQTGGDYVLAAVATGVILNMILNN